MNSNELMLGDWVLDAEFDRNIPRRVEIIEPRRVWLEGNNLYQPIRTIQPIPLTAEILEKNGFERTTCGVDSIIYTFSDDDEYYALAIDEYTDSIWRVEYTNCEMSFPLVRIMVLFVHELQHALRLCGIEKDIEL